jgi:hypothetical protein
MCRFLKDERGVKRMRECVRRSRGREKKNIHDRKRLEEAAIAYNGR